MTELSGLTEAMNAARAVGRANPHAVVFSGHPLDSYWRCMCGATGTGIEAATEHQGAELIRAAAPILVRAALRQAADDLNVIVSERGTLLWFIEGESRLESVAGWLRDRADSITEGTTP